MWNLKIQQTSKYKKKKKQTYRYRKQTSSYQWGEGSREGHYRGRGLRGANYYI